MMKLFETRFKGTYVIEDSGKNYIYDEAKNDLHEATNLEMGFYKPSKYDSYDYEYDHWSSWK